MLNIVDIALGLYLDYSLFQFSPPLAYMRSPILIYSLLRGIILTDWNTVGTEKPC
jgi:hypothetical protein